jgi:hypothetical protein
MVTLVVVVTVKVAVFQSLLLLAVVEPFVAKNQPKQNEIHSLF